MVLQEAEVSPGFADTAPTGVSDPYASSSSSSPASYQRPQPVADLPPSIHLSHLPRPIPILGPLYGYTDKYLAQLVRTDAAKVSNILQRPLKMQEWEAVAYHAAKWSATTSYAVPVGSALGILRSQLPSAKENFQFPLFKPEPPGGKAFFNKLGPLTGNAAVQGWHALRGWSYASVGALIAYSLFRSYAATVNVLGQWKDPRLAEFINVIRDSKMAGNTPRNVGGASEAQRARRPQPQPDPQEAIQRTDISSMGESGALGNDDRYMGDQPRSEQEVRQFDFGLDGSSTASNESHSAQESPTSPASSASSAPETSWERIRRGNAPIPQPGQPRRPLQGTGGDAWAKVRGSAVPVGNGFEGEQTPGSTSGDSFSFSTGDEDRQLARQEAQKEFDERVERERHGGEFDQQRQGGWRR